MVANNEGSKKEKGKKNDLPLQKLHSQCKLAVDLKKCDDIRKVLGRHCMGKVPGKAAEC